MSRVSGSAISSKLGMYRYLTFGNAEFAFIPVGCQGLLFKSIKDLLKALQRFFDGGRHFDKMIKIYFKLVDSHYSSTACDNCRSFGTTSSSQLVLGNPNKSYLLIQLR